MIEGWVKVCIGLITWVDVAGVLDKDMFAVGVLDGDEDSRGSDIGVEGDESGWLNDTEVPKGL